MHEIEMTLWPRLGGGKSYPPPPLLETPLVLIDVLIGNKCERFSNNVIFKSKTYLHRFKLTMVLGFLDIS